MKIANFFIRELRVTPNEYNNQIIDSGFEWVKCKFAKDDSIQGKVLSSDAFWSWWWSQWNIRNEELYYSVIAYYSSEDASWLRSEYQKVHNVETIKESIFSKFKN